MAAIKFWEIQKEDTKLILTDERFNNLSTYRDTVMSFFSKQNSDEAMNHDEN